MISDKQSKGRKARLQFTIMNFFIELKWPLVFAAFISLITSIGFLSLFSFPHSPDMPDVQSWQKVGAEIIAAVHDMEDDINDIFGEEDDALQLLLSTSNMVGSLGYERATFYMTLAPYWNIMLTITSLFSLSMILTSLVMLFYLLLSLRVRDRFCIVPWIFQHILLEILLLVILVILLMDVSNTARVELEMKEGTAGNYATVVVVFIAATIYVFLCVLAGSMHVVEQVELMNRQITMAQYILRINQQILA